MPNPRDPLRILDAIYTFDDDDHAWVARIADALEPYGFGDGGVGVYISTFGKRNAVTAFENRTRHPSAVVYAMAKLLPAGFYRRIHAPMPLCTSTEMWPEICAAHGLPDFTKASFRGWTPPKAWAICGGELDVRTALAVFHCRRDEAPSPGDHHVLDQVGAHLGAALRLRSLIAPEPRSEDRSVGAVLSPEGQLLHAEANEADERASLIDAVRRTEKAKLRRASAEERLDVWTALVDGKWSILESVERDGKRFLLAYRNAPATRPLRELVPRERIVAEYAALGHPLKYIAYELGISIATAALDLETALRKLGVKNRAELIQLFARAH